MKKESYSHFQIIITLFHMIITLLNDLKLQCYLKTDKNNANIDHMLSIIDSV